MEDSQSRHRLSQVDTFNATVPLGAKLENAMSSLHQLLEDYPSLTSEGLDAALAFGSSLSEFQDVTSGTSTGS